MADDWITTTEACQTTGYHPVHMRRLIRTGKVKARKFGPVWQVSKESLLNYLKQIETKGERRGPKTGKT